MEKYIDAEDSYTRLIRGEANDDDKDKLKDFLKEFKEETFVEHIDVYDKIIKLNTNKIDLSQKKKTQLFDEIIHLEHHRGNLWGIYYIDELRQQFEEEYL